MLEAILKLLPSKSAKVVALLVLVLIGGGIGGIKGLAFIRAQAQETARSEVKIIINDELREAATEAAVFAAKKAAREAAKETAEEIRKELRSELKQQTAFIKAATEPRAYAATVRPDSTVRVEAKVEAKK